MFGAKVPCFNYLQSQTGRSSEVEGRFMNKFTIGLACQFAALVAAAASASLELPIAQYGIGQWNARGFGNHRAVLTVAQAAPAVEAYIPWRRRDVKPETKAVLVFDSTGKQVMNVKVEKITAAEGIIVFEASQPGDYYIYWLPYNPGTGSFDNPSTYFVPKNTAATDWLAKLGKNLPMAPLKEIQARGKFHTFYPMEVMPTPGEVSGLIQRTGNKPYLLFAEDRTRSVRMRDAIPVKWVVDGPTTQFIGNAQPNEWYPWQVAVWACGAPLEKLSVKWSDFVTADGKTIPADEITCLNTEGTDALGKPFTAAPNVEKSKVQPLWLIASIPENAAGTYRGTVTVKPQNAAAQTIEVVLKVSGKVLPDHGVGELWRLSRLKWLNSTIGDDNEVISPFKPVVIDGNTFNLTTSQVTFGKTGLPEKIMVGGRDILAQPVSFNIYDTAGKQVAFSTDKSQNTMTSPEAVGRVTTAQNSDLAYRLENRIDTDGSIVYRLVLKANRDAAFKNMELTIPLTKEVATYLMGFGVRGGMRKAAVDWRWDLKRATNYLWIGEVWGGLQLKLTGASDNWDGATLETVGLPQGWYNDNRGGGRVVESDTAVNIMAYSGARKMVAGKELVFQFRLMVTPSKPLTAAREHWNYRYAGPRANIRHFHHGKAGNLHINYPFLELDLLRKLVATWHNQVRRKDSGEFFYPTHTAVSPTRGSIEATVKVNFDPTLCSPKVAGDNQPFMTVEFDNGDLLNLYWNVDVHGLRVYLQNKASGKNISVINCPTPAWQLGSQARVGVSWADGILSLWLDGNQVGKASYPATWNGGKADKGRIVFTGNSFGIGMVRTRNRPLDAAAATAPLVRDAATWLLDQPGAATSAVKCHRKISREEGFTFNGDQPVAMAMGTNLYYTVRELSNYLPEIWALRSLGNEVYMTGNAFVYSVEKSEFGGSGGGDPWLQEHLISGYAPAWRQPLGNNEVDAAIGTTGLSRWHNYYLEGLNWLMRDVGIDGLYLDGIGYDCRIMRRVVKVMERNNPDYRINAHIGNSYDFMDMHSSGLSVNMEHLPYVKDLWSGEFFDYDRNPDYWLVEISGIPFGVYSDMLQYENGGNAYRGMVFGMTGRLHQTAPTMYDLWDRFGIADAKMLGYWDKQCPIRTDNSEVLATVYRKPGKVLIAAAHWPKLKRPDTGKREISVLLEQSCGEIVIDGKVSDAEWTHGAQSTGFSKFGDMLELAPAEQSVVKIRADREKLYVALTANGKDALAAITKHNGKVWHDDAFEFYFGKGKDLVHLIVNSLGTTWAEVPGGGDLRGLKIASIRKTDRWTCEFSIPWSSLGVSQVEKGQSFTLNIFRDHKVPRNFISMWSPVRKYKDTAGYGVLRLGNSATVEKTTAFDLNDQIRFRLCYDWKNLGLNPKKCRLIQPEIENFQPAAEYKVNDAIPIHFKEGAILILEERQ